MGITFGVVGHNEAETLARALSLCVAAARPDDVVVFIDSSSTDDSASIARGQGCDVWSAPIGKGNAVHTAISRSSTEWLVLIDGDVHDCERNIPATLASHCERSEASMVLGDFTDRVAAGILSNTWGIYEPLISVLFPETAGRCGGKPLTGFRALRLEDDWGLGRFPPDFGVEAHLNICATVRGRGVEVAELGWYLGAFRYKPYMGVEIGAAVLDAAESMGRLAGARRPEWERWVREVADVVATYRGDPDDLERFRGELARARARPLPAAV